MRRAAGIVVALLAAIAVPGRASADEAETESRLKSAGVPRELRARIHEAIDRGVRYLASVQRRDGRWRDGLYSGWTEWGITALCALAQRHAGTAEGTASARRAMAWLQTTAGAPPPTPGATRRSAPALSQVYCAGLWLLCLQADGRSAEDARPTVLALSKGLDPDSAWWGYDVRGEPSSVPNLSTSQFAALGLWAGGRLGARADRGTWTAHLGALCASQLEGGGWSYSPVFHDARGRRIPPTNSPYPTGTFMGCANLALAIAGSGDPASPSAPPPGPVAAVRARALARLEKDGRAFIEAMDGSRPGFAYAKTFGFSYYALYALEKACVLNGLPTLEGVAWYVRGAEALLRVQSADGSWTCRVGPDPLASTAFSLLFLLRSSESFHPTTPRPVDAPPPPPVTTPGTGPSPSGGMGG